MNRSSVNEEKIRVCLASSPLRLTKKRECILKALLISDRPVSAEELRVRADLTKSDLVTVYRTIEAFIGIGIVQGIPLENGSSIYELTEPGEHFHHFVCRKCHKTERIDLCLASQLGEIANELGYTEVSHVMEIYGLCKDCH